MKIKFADVMAGPSVPDLNPNSIQRACPSCGMMASSGGSVCPNCGCDLRSGKRALFENGITEQTLKDLEKSLVDNGVEESKAKEVATSLKDFSQGKSPAQNEDEYPDTGDGQQNPSGEEIADTGEQAMKNVLKPLEKLSGYHRKTAVSAPDYDDDLESLREKNSVSDVVLELGWIVTPFTFGFTYQSQMDQSNSEAFYANMEDNFPDDVGLAYAAGSNAKYVIIRAFDEDGEVTPAGKELEETMGALTQYPVLNDDDYSSREYEAQMEFVSDLRPKDEDLQDVFDSLTSEQYDVVKEELFEALWRNMEMEEDLGSFSVFLYDSPDIDSVFTDIFGKLGIVTEQRDLFPTGASRRMLAQRRRNQTGPSDLSPINQKEFNETRYRQIEENDRNFGPRPSDKDWDWFQNERAKRMSNPKKSSIYRKIA